MSQARGETERDRLLRIIGLCMAVESRGLNPFEVEVQQILGTLREYLPRWIALDDIILDAQTLNQIATVVSLQGEWLKRRSTSLFVDPLLVELKLKMMSSPRLTAMFALVWRPIVEMEGLSGRRVQEAVDYWNNLVSLEERRLKLPNATDSLGTVTKEELIKRKLLSEKTFAEVLNILWLELKERTASEGRIHYWNFIYADTYEETVNRAYLVSFLITYGYATMQINPLEEEIYLIPNKDLVEPSSRRQAISIPIAVDRETWRKMGDEKH